MGLPELLFVTGNKGKAESAQRSLAGIVRIVQHGLMIPETQPTVQEVAIHKARTAYDAVHAPLIVDDSGFGIDRFGGWPGVHAKRALEKHGLDYFLDLAEMYGPLPSSFVQVLAYMDATLDEPALFTSIVPGTLIDEARGERKPFLKSDYGYAFIISGLSKTVAELSEEEFAAHAASDRWKRFAVFYQINNKA